MYTNDALYACYNNKCDFSEVATAWLETLLDVIDLLPKDVIKKDVRLIELLFGLVEAVFVAPRSEELGITT